MPLLPVTTETSLVLVKAALTSTIPKPYIPSAYVVVTGDFGMNGGSIIYVVRREGLAAPRTRFIDLETTIGKEFLHAKQCLSTSGLARFFLVQLRLLVVLLG